MVYPPKITNFVENDNPMILWKWGSFAFRQTHVFRAIYTGCHTQEHTGRIDGNFRNLNWRYLPYIRPIFQAYVREYPQKIWPKIWY